MSKQTSIEKSVENLESMIWNHILLIYEDEYMKETNAQLISNKFDDIKNVIISNFNFGVYKKTLKKLNISSEKIQEEKLRDLFKSEINTLLNVYAKAYYVKHKKHIFFKDNQEKLNFIDEYFEMDIVDDILNNEKLNNLQKSQLLSLRNRKIDEKMILSQFETEGFSFDTGILN